MTTKPSTHSTRTVDKGKISKVLLIIADISGYTRYMTENKTDLLHSQILLTEITESLLQRIDVPLQVSKLEGDAIFLYAEVDESWEANKVEISSRILSFFEVFTEKVTELAESNICRCIACKNVDALKLKVVAHYGEALIHKIGQFEELSGVDVIVVHRLLKNSLKADEYLMLTDTAFAHLTFPERDIQVEWKEHYDQIGEVRGKAWVAENHLVPNDALVVSGQYRTLSFKLRNEWMKVKRVVSFKFRPSKVLPFSHLP